MNQIKTLSPTRSAGMRNCSDRYPGRHPQHSRLWKVGAAAVLASALATPAHAVDGCLVLLCLAAPSWRQIPQCVPPIEELHRDLAMGRPFPRCEMGGAGNDARNEPSNAPTLCPPQYTHQAYAENGVVYGCDYASVISVQVNGTLWTRVWWNFGGDSVTEFTPAAKAQLGTWDTRFDQDYSAWLAAQPPADEPPPPPPQSNGG